MAELVVSKNVFTEDPDDQEFNESWLEFFDDNLEDGKKFFYSQNLVSPGHFSYSDNDWACTEGEIITYTSFLTSKTPNEIPMTYNMKRYTFIRALDDLSDDKSPIFFFAAKDDTCPETNEKFIVLLKFVSEDVIFLGKTNKYQKAGAIKFVQESYRYDDDSE